MYWAHRFTAKVILVLEIASAYIQLRHSSMVQNNHLRPQFMVMLHTQLEFFLYEFSEIKPV